ncbi:MAG: N-acetylmuramoyl-L-alanine amidase [Actinobacteria bacterium]|nr:N-acetylmuramoyl-L-alanine amidase [Actinomycetota bacterium]
MADISARLQRVVARLRTVWGITVVLVPGWETRGAGQMKVLVGHVQHHVGGPRTGDAPSLRTVTFGRARLRNSLSMWFTARTSGVAYLVAAGVSWHAGRSSWGGYTSLNDKFAGNEAEHSGQADERWTDASLYTQAAIAYEMCREFAHPLSNIAEHKEVATRRGRKPDRVAIDGSRWRRRIGAMKPPHIEEVEMKRGDKGAHVVGWIDAVPLLAAALGVDVAGLDLAADRKQSTFGGATEAATNRLLKELDRPENGIADSGLVSLVALFRPAPSQSVPEHPHSELVKKGSTVTIRGTIAG